MKLKLNVRNCLVAFLTVLVSMTTLSAFAGGELYEIFLNKKLMYTVFPAHDDGDARMLSLTGANKNDELIIVHKFCNAPSKNGSIVVSDRNKKVLKTWHFSSMKNDDQSMHIRVADLLSLNKSGELFLHYVAPSQTTRGHQLVSISFTGKKVVKSGHNDPEFPLLIAGWAVLCMAATGFIYYKTS